MAVRAVLLLAVSGAVLGQGGRAPRVTCPTVGGTPFTGTDQYRGKGPVAAPLRGNVGCVDLGPLATREEATAGGQTVAANNIYGPMEAGFTSAQPGASCLGSYELPGGVDTNLAEGVMQVVCDGSMRALLDYCGGHAVPFHYHERASCLYTEDPSTKHSTRLGTALDGNGIYGHNIDGGCEPTDLDWCGGRRGVTPDSDGKEVYYYVLTNRAPFALGCFGPVATQDACRALYDTCDGETVELTTEHGTDLYDLDCPCFDPVTGSNLPGVTEKPKFLGPDGFEHFSCPTCTAEQKAKIAAQYASKKCTGDDSSKTPTPPQDTPAPVPVCPADVKECEDGSFVARDALSGCNFLACPTLAPDNGGAGSRGVPAAAAVVAAAAMWLMC
eukprot:TRINITY_DN8679_c0_g1_i1.p1 TRINITY_DN8679_c0_g1~~TRINITY_DN8679_c0_g1_i1.p1  ORF type:complete len:385 (+),score=75.05 TRINITY_DN8679_c0_g1_i1:67-1221(+)